MAGQLAGLAHARGAGAWLSASPRVQRLVAAYVALVLGAALTAVAVHQGPERAGEPLALAAASGPVPAREAVVADERAARTGRVAASRTATRRAHQKAAPAPAPAPRGWAYWSVRIRGCESHGRPDAPPDYKAKNPDSSASGAYQITDTTWGGRFGVYHASEATPEQQEAAASDLYRRHGTADWAASAPCWRDPTTSTH